MEGSSFLSVSLVALGGWEGSGRRVNLGPMPYRLRLYDALDANRLLIASDCATVEEAGQLAGGFPLDEFQHGSHASIKRELTFIDARTGEQREPTSEEAQRFLEVTGKHLQEAVGGSLRCSRCGREVAEHGEPYPVLAAPDGPVAFSCWTPEERERMAL
jgi:hypothetical protein